MNAAELLGGAMKLIGALGPFVLVFLAIASAGELIDLVRHAAKVARDRRWG